MLLSLDGVGYSDVTAVLSRYVSLHEQQIPRWVDLAEIHLGVPDTKKGVFGEGIRQGSVLRAAVERRVLQ